MTNECLYHCSFYFRLAWFTYLSPLPGVDNKQNVFYGVPQRTYYNLKGTNIQASGQMSQNIQNRKTVEIELVRPTEVCGKV